MQIQAKPQRYGDVLRPASAPAPRQGRPEHDPDSVADLYQRWFDIVPVTTDALREDIYRLRYQVYCVEHPFENPQDFPDGMERDRFDGRSVHTALMHRSTGSLAGTVRLVLPNGQDPSDSFPMQQICPVRDFPLMGELPLRTTGEISRYAVSKAFRRRSGEGQYADVGWNGRRGDGINERRIAPYITLGLMRGVMDMSVAHGVTHLIAVMPPALLQLVARIGLTFTPLGPPVEHHGRRQPCYATLADLIAGVQAKRHDLWNAARKLVV